MQTYDLLMLSILVGLTLYGYFKGMAWQIAYIASFVASYFVAMRYCDQVAPHVPYVNAPLNKFVAILLIYIAASMVVWMIFRIVRRGIDSVKMEGFDHQMGALIGFARGVLWCVAVTFFMVTLLPGNLKQTVIQSKSGNYIAQLLDKTDSVFPPEVHQVIGPYLDRLEGELNSPTTGGVPAAPATAFGWPSAAPATNPAPAWPQAQPASSPAPAAAPSAPAWPAPATQTSTTQTATDLGWPSAQPSAPPANSTPAQPASWPDWP